MTAPPDEPAPPSIDDVPVEDLTLEVEVAEARAERTIDHAVRGRRNLARKYVKWTRRHNPDATPAQIVFLIERHYLRAIRTAGAALTAGGIALDVGVTMIPIVGPVTNAFVGEAGKKVVKEGIQRGAEVVMERAARVAFVAGAASHFGRIAGALPAGDEQLQFEITALFALSLADIHGLELDNDQATALVYGLSNGRVPQKQIAATARALAQSLEEGGTPVRKAPWVTTLATDLPGPAAKALVRGIQTGTLENVPSGRDGQVKPLVEFGVGSLVDGSTRFIFGREVVDGSRSAFPGAPDAFPDHLGIDRKPAADDESNPALEALKTASKTVGGTLSTSAGVVGTHVSKAAGIAAKQAGTQLSRGAGAARGFISNRIKPKPSPKDSVRDQPSDGSRIE